MALDDAEQIANKRLGYHIIIAVLLGAVCGWLLKYVIASPDWIQMIDVNVFQLLGDLFIRLIKMMVVPIVLVSLICGVASLNGLSEVGRVGIRTLVLYLMTTAFAVALALSIATLLGVGSGIAMKVSDATINMSAVPSWRETLLGAIPNNPFAALSSAHMLAIIVFAVLFGLAVSATYKEVSVLHQVLVQTNKVLMRLMVMLMRLAPYGVFCILTHLFLVQGLDLIIKLMHYFVVVLLVLLLQAIIVYSGLLLTVRLNPLKFFRKMWPAMSFAFSISSSNASIPVVMGAVSERLGVNKLISSFVIPLGATINMDGTAIMQGVATVFIAHIYHVHLDLTDYLMVIAMATLASIGTAGVPGVGMVTLAMVLRQVHLPVEGIALIIGVDRLLDMARTAINVSGDATIACVVANSEDSLDRQIFNNKLV